METTQRLYLGGLPPETTVDDVRRLFAAFGELAAVDLITDRVTGALVPGRSPEAWAEAIRGTIARRLPAGPIRAHAQRFGPARFASEIRTEVDRVFASA